MRNRCLTGQKLLCFDTDADPAVGWNIKTTTLGWKESKMAAFKADCEC